MARQFGLSGQELLQDWHAAQKRGMTQAQHAASIGLKYNTYCSRLYRAQSERLAGISIPESRYHVWTDHIKLTGDFLILGDMHIPYHDGPFIEGAIKTAMELGITRCIIGGDALEFDAVSHWPGDFSAETETISDELEDKLLLAAGDNPQVRAAIADILSSASRPENMGAELKESRRVLKAIDAAFDEIIYIMGNHEQRIIKALEKVIGTSDLAAMLEINWKISPYYFCEFTSGGLPWRVTHPKNSGKGSSKKLSPKYDANIIMLHGHNFSVQSSPNGRYIAIEPGACVSLARLDYEMQRDTSGDMHTAGAVIVKDGKARLINPWLF